MDRIPPEIIYIVCSLLDVDDILNFRLVNKLFAEIGAAYMLPEVTFYLHQDEFDRLKAISLHPIFSRHVTSLTYFAETLDSPAVSWREFVREHRSRMRWNGKLRKLNLTPSQLMAEYKKYNDAVDEQDLLMSSKKDVDLLKEVLPRFTKLESLTMSAGNLFYEGRYRTHRRKPFTDILRSGYMSGIHPEGKRPLDALLLANAHSPCALKTLRAGSLHWRFFKRSERDLQRMFKPLANLTSIELSVNVDPSDDRIHDGNSLRKCQRLLAKGAIRGILKSMPHLESMFIEILNLECDEQDKGACLKDIIEPGLHWPNLKELVLGGIVGERTEFMNLFLLHKDTLRKLCLRDVTLFSTSWRKFLPDIRKNLRLEEACICGDIYGVSEEETDEETLWPYIGGPENLEYWDLSVPEVGSHYMRQSINVYCRHGGEKYPDQLPLSEFVVDQYYDQYVDHLFLNEDDFDDDDYYNDEFGIDNAEEDNDGSWEDVSDGNLDDDDDDDDDDMSDSSMDPASRGEAALAFHMIMAGAFGPSPGLDYYDDNDVMGNNPDVDSGSDTHGEAGLGEVPDFPPWILAMMSGFPPAAAPVVQPDMDSGDGDSGDEMPDLIPQ